MTYEVINQTELEIFSTLKTVTVSSLKRRYFPYQTTHYQFSWLHRASVISNNALNYINFRGIKIH